MSTWLSASSVCSVISVGPEGSTGPSIEGLDPNPAREPFQNKKLQHVSFYFALYLKWKIRRTNHHLGWARQRSPVQQNRATPGEHWCCTRDWTPEAVPSRSGFLKTRGEPDPPPTFVFSLWWYEPACCLLMELRGRHPGGTEREGKRSVKSKPPHLFWDSVCCCPLDPGV